MLASAAIPLSSELSAKLSILRRPANKARLLRLIDFELARADADRARREARAQAEEAERQFEQQLGAKADHEAELQKCSADLIHWINTWVWTYDPRLIGQRDEHGAKLSPYIRFVLFPKQVELAHWTLGLIQDQEQGALDKSRDIGATYEMAAILLHQWLFVDGFKGTFLSRDADLVDTLGDPDSIFEKIRIIARRLPEWMMPIGFSWRQHDNLMRFSNPATGAVLVGDAGDEGGRGGRSSVVVVDEGAFIKRAARVEKAISANADCIIWTSSSNGMGTLFYRKKMTLPPAQVFRFHYSDDPRKTAEWVAKKRASMDAIAWASEYEIDDAASIEGVCIPAAWVQAAQLLAKLEPAVRAIGKGVAGVDIGGGKAKSVVVVKHGPIVSPPAYRTGADTTDTAYWALEQTKAMGAATLNFDAPGIGAGVASTLSKAEGFPSIRSVPINTGTNPTKRVWPDDRTSEDMFGNLKAELWWLARTAFQKTFWHVQYLQGVEGFVPQPVDELVALPADITLAAQLSLCRWFRNEAGKIVIETKKQLQTRGIPSPDFADAFVLAFLEEPDDGIEGLQLDVDAFKRVNPWSIGGTSHEG